MSQTEKWKWVYKVVRSVLFTTVTFVAFLYVALYVLLSIPGVQTKIRNVAEEELSKLFTSTLKIDNVSIYPFNEVVVEGVTLYEPDSTTECVKIERLGAGVSLWKLLRDRKIVITYVELLGLDARLRQDVKGGNLNIQFLIDAFKPKEKNKPPTPFDLEIRNIVIRKSMASFSRPWLSASVEKFPNLSEIKVSQLSADLTIPRLSNDVMIFDLRRLEVYVEDMIKIESLKAIAGIDHGTLSIRDFSLQTSSSNLTVSDLTLPLKYPGGIHKWLESNNISISIDAPLVNPSEFAFLWSPLDHLDSDMSLRLELDGNLSGVNVKNLQLSTAAFNRNLDGYFALSLSGVADLEDYKGRRTLNHAKLEKLSLQSSPGFNSKLVGMLKSDGVNNGKAAEVISAVGNIDLRASGRWSTENLSGNSEAVVDVELLSGLGNVDLSADWIHASSTDKINMKVNSPGIDFGKLLAVDFLGHTVIDLKAEAAFDNQLFHLPKGASVDQIASYVRSAQINLNLPEAVIKHYKLTSTTLDLTKRDRHIEGMLSCRDNNFNLGVDLNLLMAGADSELSLVGDIENLRPGVINGILETLSDDNALYGRKDFIASGSVDMRLRGNNPDNLEGEIGLNDLHFRDVASGKSLNLDNLEIIASIEDGEDPYRNYSIISDWIEGGISGRFRPSRVPKVIHGMLSETYPTLIKAPSGWEKMRYDDDFVFDFTIKRHGEWAQFLNLPIDLLYEAEVKGEFNGSDQTLTASVSAPYIQQGKDKLIRKSCVNATLCEGSGNINFNTVVPTKKGDLEILGNISSVNGEFGLSLDFNPDKTTSFYGCLDMAASVHNPVTPLKGKEVKVRILPSTLYLNHAAWNVAEALLSYYPTPDGPRAEIKGFSVSHDNQFVTISGSASTSPDDEVLAILNEVDLDYIFDTLNINYVKFGGQATGEAIGRGLLSKNIQAETKSLHVKDLSYNGAILGDGELHGDFDISRKRIGIRADISEDKRQVAIVDGGIWLGRDSLSFGIDADKVRIGFLAPFMQAFASKVEGRASGNALLYGTFSDVNMKGRLFADTISLGVTYTNVTYCGSDSVFIDPGRIVIPSFKLYDVQGHSAILTGELTHRYFHDPEFDFRISNASNLLLYDTNPGMNPVWYGRIYGSGSGQILGRGNYVGITADMTTEPNSTFTFVLSDQLEATEYNFLTFTDKAKAKREAEKPVEISETDFIVEAFKKKVQEMHGPESVFGMDIRATLTPGVQMTLVMDPVAGDKIIARGSGAMNMEYRSDTDDLKMYGKYVLDEGMYNFSLQDVILKDFIIKQGSSISFNGDPMAGLLDIRAAYRVNTNLADLDQSFAMDRDLNRTQVPVDAMLIVSGDMTQPDITFDIELPTLNDEVEQKVRSVISSEDMMNLQMIYLLALNRFYTPEYMGGSSGGEWASVASSTISSQLQNVLGQLTDKFNVAPSIRSDKGDFSDVEVDVALSSRLFNNRLLINGNLGYRDPSTSSTTFIGDFDIEYLLNSSGNWRLKAYNHFNDQNYYLKSALTTQGVGIVWQRDFNHIFGIRKRQKPQFAPESESKDAPKE
ncbi:MAG: translocation/assembly module TamB domain-containing protein [Muribaculaceae bacterium]|nr:translocation/assembly module TamB domain-containing protein [Muribaculaceae bacterium]